MFSLHDFLMQGIKGMIGNEPDYKVIKYSMGWYDKQLLNETDLAEIQILIEDKKQAVSDEEILAEIQEFEKQIENAREE